MRAVSLAIGRAETLVMVGESGCGKSRLGRVLLQLPRPDSGKVPFGGADLTTLEGGSSGRCSATRD